MPQNWSKVSETVRNMRGLAEWYNALPKLEKDRGIDEDWQKELAAHMERRTFLAENATIATISVDGETYKLNGQHTCSAYSSMNGTAPDMKVRYCHYQAKDLQAAAELYMLLDTHKSRTYKHLSRMFWGSIGLLDKYTDRDVSLAACAAVFDKGGGTTHNRKSIRGQDRIRIVTEYARVIPAVVECLGPSTIKFLRREAVVAAILQTLKVNKDAARKFWDEVRTGEMLPKTSPALRIRNWLLNIHSTRGAGTGVYRKADFSEMYTRCIHAWNAWRDGGTTDLKYYRTTSLPKAR